jgi:uncharacterized protein (TIGR02391 family)
MRRVTCPLCWNSAKVSEARGSDGGVRAADIFDCERCGHFEITEEAQTTCTNLRTSNETEQRYLLSALTRRATEEGRSLTLTTQAVEQLLETPWPTAEQQNALFLAYIARKTKKRGDSVAVSHKTDYPLFFAKGEKESAVIAVELAGIERIKVTNQGATNYYTLTPQGRSDLSSLPKTVPYTPTFADTLSTNPQPGPQPGRLHPTVNAASSALIRDGHCAQAVFEAAKALVLEVRTKSGSKLDGASLMRTVFSRNSPLLAFNLLVTQSDQDEQEGMMHLYEGAVLAVRNPRAHSPVTDSPESAQRYLELLSFLAYRLDETTRRQGP